MYVDDLTRVHHMHDAAGEAIRFTERKTRGVQFYRELLCDGLRYCY